MVGRGILGLMRYNIHRHPPMFMTPIISVHSGRIWDQGNSQKTSYTPYYFSRPNKNLCGVVSQPHIRTERTVIIGVTNTWVSWPKLFHSPTCSPRPLSARAQLCSLPICQMPHLLVSHSLSLSPQLLSFDTIFRHMTCNGERWSAGKVGPEQKQYWVYGP